jgi:MFS family permease
MPSSGSSIGEMFKQDFRLRERPELRVVFLIFSLETVGFSMLIVSQTYFMMKELGMSPLQIGTVLSANMATQMVGAAVSGRFSDAFGRRLVLIVAFFWVGSFQIAISFVRNFQELLINRVLIGICGGTFALSAAPVLDVEPDKERRSMYMGLFAAVSSLAFSIGPGIGALLIFSDTLTRRQLFVVVGLFAISSGIIAFFFLKETLSEERRRPLCGPAMEDESSEGHIGKSDWDMVNLGLSLVWTSNFLADFAKFFLYSLYAILINDLFGYEDAEFGIILMCAGLGGMLVQGLVFPVIVKATGLHATIVLGAALSAIGLAFLPLVTSFFLHFSLLGIFITGTSLWEPGIPVLLGQYTSPWHLGSAIGINFLFARVGSIISPIIGGWSYGICGSCSFFIGSAAFALGGLLVLLAFFCATEVSATAAEKFEAKYIDEAGGRARETESLR